MVSVTIVEVDGPVPVRLRYELRLEQLQKNLLLRSLVVGLLDTLSRWEILLLLSVDPIAVTVEQVEKMPDGTANIVRCPVPDKAAEMVAFDRKSPE